MTDAAAILRQMKDLETLEVPGRLTEMTCTCGGKLRDIRTLVVPTYRPRHHRKKRIRKKWKARWEKENRARVHVGVMMGLMQRPSYRCETCGKRDGFYSAAGRNMILVERLPEAARSLWDRETGELDWRRGQRPNCGVRAGRHC